MYYSEKRKCEIDIFGFCIIFISPKNRVGSFSSIMDKV